MYPDNPSRLLVVEGQDDRHVVTQLRKHQAAGLSFEIRDVKGYQNLLQAISPEVKAPGRERLGFLLDADSDLNDHWTKIKSELKRAGVSPPSRLGRNGCIFGSTLTIGVWIMPDNQSSGELENFIIGMLPDQDPVWPLACEYIDAIPQHIRKYKNEKTDKAKLHAWLSTRKKPGRMGAAIGAGDLDLSKELNLKFLEWLTNLFA